MIKSNVPTFGYVGHGFVLVIQVALGMKRFGFITPLGIGLETGYRPKERAPK